MNSRFARGAIGGGVLLGLALAHSGGHAESQRPADPVPLGRLAVSTLQPGVGQLVELEVPYAGPWPVSASWEGVDEDEGLRARVVARDSGELLVSAFGVEARIQVHPGANRGELPTPELGLRSLPWLDGRCEDARWPRLAGEWALGCSGAVVSRAQQLLTGQQVKLERAVARPATAPGLLWAPRLDGGVWRLPDPSPAREGPIVPIDDSIAPPTSNGEQVALVRADQVELFRLEDNRRQRISARPAPWYPPALAAEHVAWVDRRDPMSGEDIWLAGPSARDGVPLARSAAHERHPAGSGRWLGWIEDDAVVVEDLLTGERRRTPTDAHTSRSLSMWGPVACWEEWTGSETDLRCSDGLVLRRPGMQRSPSRYGPWLLFVEEGRAMLATARTLVLDDDDPRATHQGQRIPDEAAFRGARVAGGVRYELSDWPGRWSVERWEEGAWVAVGPLSGGTVEAPAGDAIRLSWLHQDSP